MTHSTTYRYPGVKPFSSNESDLFFGRDEDNERLYRLLKVENTIVLHSKSGFGKSSLINAGLIPAIISENEYYPFQIKLSGYRMDNDVIPLQHLIHQFQNSELNTESEINSELAEVLIDNRLWSQVKKIQIQSKVKDFIIFIDQFEELFTYPQNQIDDFKHTVAEMLYTDIPQRYRIALKSKIAAGEYAENNENFHPLFEPFSVKFVFVIRSDKMSLLSTLTDVLPNILLNCYELKPLNRIQAKDAIMIPALYSLDNVEFKSKPFTYSNEALSLMLDYLSNNTDKSVEAFQLQILCQFAENVVIETNAKVIDVKHLGDISSIYLNYYDNLIKKLSIKEEQDAARKLIEEGLIYELEERRLSLYEGIILHEYNISKYLLKKLVDNHLIRAEIHPTGGVSYELPHDSLVASILRSKHNRLAMEQKMLEEQKAKALKAEIEHKAKEAAKKRVKAILRNMGIAVSAVLLILTSYLWYQNYQLRKTQARMVLIYQKAVDARNGLMEALNETTENLINEKDWLKAAYDGSVDFITPVNKTRNNQTSIGNDIDSIILLTKEMKTISNDQNVHQLANKFENVIISLKKTDLLVNSGSYTREQIDSMFEKTKLDVEMSEIDTAILLYKKRKYEEAFKIFNRFQNDKVAQYYLAIMYQYGQGCELNRSKAVDFAEKSSNQKYYIATYILGKYHYDGLLVPKNEAKAIDLFQKAATNGIPEANYALGILANKKQKDSEAFNYFLKAADANLPIANLEVGKRYESGKGTTKNTQKALFYIKRAADAGNPEAKEILKNYY